MRGAQAPVVDWRSSQVSGSGRLQKVAGPRRRHPVLDLLGEFIGQHLIKAAARPPFAIDRLRKQGSDLVYRCAKQHSEPTGDRRGAKMDELTLTPLELIDHIAALVPPPRTHRHRYFGVLAPNSPLRASAVGMALAAPVPVQQAAAQTGQNGKGECAPAVAPLGNAVSTQPAPPKRSPAHYLWAVLIARIYEVFPLACPMCGGGRCA